MVLVVGPPRSGSTLISQMLVRVIPCAYASNLHAIAPTLMEKLRRSAPAVSGPLRSYYGYTGSLSDVNEANELFDAMFKGEPSRETLRRRFLTLAAGVGAGRDRPLIAKNVRSFERITELHAAVPELFFLRVRRDREQVVQSVLRAFHLLGTFHPIPRRLRGHSMGDPVAFAVDQIGEIESRISEQLAGIPESQWTEWSYEGFCADPATLIDKLAVEQLQIAPEDLRREWFREQFRASFSTKVTPEESERISRLLAENYADRVEGPRAETG